MPTRYKLQGTLKLLISNVSYPFTAAFDLSQPCNQLGFISYYDNLSYTVCANSSTYHVFTQSDHQNCTISREAMPIMLPNPTSNFDWTQLNNTLIRGKQCQHYQSNTFNGTAPDNSSFAFNRTVQQNYYCYQFENECVPVRWETRGYNTDQQSHFDFDTEDIDGYQGVKQFESEVFIAPKACLGDKNQQVEWSNADILLGILNNNVLWDQDEKEKWNGLQQGNKSSNFTFKTGSKRFSAADPDQIRRMYTGLIPSEFPSKKYASSQNLSLPRELDLRTKACIAPVADQAICGSCWAFGAAGLIEGRLNFRRRNLNQPFITVSAQQILSCLWALTPPYRNIGCSGGSSTLAMNMIMWNFQGKIPLAKYSPYLGIEGFCNDSAWTDQFGTIGNIIQIDKFLDYDQKVRLMKEALLNGPVSIGIAVPGSMLFYSGGVYNDNSCGFGSLAVIVHSVLCVGWGRDEELGDYWIVRNSWSNAWGVDGYIYIARDERDLCGILQKAMYFEFSPVIAFDEKQEQWEEKLDESRKCTIRTQEFDWMKVLAIMSAIIVIIIVIAVILTLILRNLKERKFRKRKCEKATTLDILD